MRFSDSLMYVRYYTKKIRLAALKKFKGLDFEGRFQDANPLFNGYEGCYPVGRILRSLNISDEDSILDIGCGKGLFLHYARKFRFSRIDGMEYSSELFRIAQSNAEKFRDARIHIFNCDARDFEGYADYNHFFFCNPFSREMMDAVISRIMESNKNARRKITVYYQFPFFKDLLVNRGFEIKYCTFLHGIFVIE